MLLAQHGASAALWQPARESRRGGGGSIALFCLHEQIERELLSCLLRADWKWEDRGTGWHLQRKLQSACSSARHNPRISLIPVRSMNPLCVIATLIFIAALHHSAMILNGAATAGDQPRARGVFWGGDPKHEMCRASTRLGAKLLLCYIVRDQTSLHRSQI